MSIINVITAWVHSIHLPRLQTLSKLFSFVDSCYTVLCANQIIKVTLYKINRIHSQKSPTLTYTLPVVSTALLTAYSICKYGFRFIVTPVLVSLDILNGLNQMLWSKVTSLLFVNVVYGSTFSTKYNKLLLVYSIYIITSSFLKLSYDELYIIN